MLKKLKPILKISITSVLFSGVFIFSQDQCPPAFISGVPLNQRSPFHGKADTLSGLGSRFTPNVSQPAAVTV